jgi:hypothetical protein
MKKLGMFLTCLAFGCSGGVPNSQGLNEKVSSVWEATDGTLFSDDFLGNVKYLSLNPTGQGTFYRDIGETGVIGCQDFLFTVTSDSRMLLERGGGEQGLSELLTYSIDDDQLTIESSSGNNIVLTRVEEVPAANLCEEIESSDVYSYDVATMSQTNLVYDGTNLYFGGYDGVTEGLFPVNPDTGDLGAPNAFPFGLDEDAVKTVQGTDFWMNSSAGDNNPIVRYSPVFAEVDSIDTSTELPDYYIDIEAAAYDGSFLWLYGFNRDDESVKFLKIDSNAEPDTVEDVVDYPSRIIEQLHFDDGYFWALLNVGNGGIAKIDPATMKAIKTYELPALDRAGYVGIAKIGANAYVLAETYEDSSQIYVFALPGESP